MHQITQSTSSRFLKLFLIIAGCVSILLPRVGAAEEQLPKQYEAQVVFSFWPRTTDWSGPTSNHGDTTVPILEFYDNEDVSEMLTAHTFRHFHTQLTSDPFERMGDPVFFRFRDPRYDKAFTGYAAWKYYLANYTYPVPGEEEGGYIETQLETSGCEPEAPNGLAIDYSISIVDTLEGPSLWAGNLIRGHERSPTYRVNYLAGNAVYPKDGDELNLDIVPRSPQIKFFTYHYEPVDDEEIVIVGPLPLGPAKLDFEVEGYTPDEYSVILNGCYIHTWRPLIAPNGSDPNAPSPLDLVPAHDPPSEYDFPYPPPPRYMEVATEEALLGISFPIGYLAKALGLPVKQYETEGRVITAAGLIETLAEVTIQAELMLELSSIQSPPGTTTTIPIRLSGGPSDLSALNVTFSFPGTVDGDDLTSFGVTLAPGISGFTLREHTLPRQNGTIEHRLYIVGGTIDATEETHLLNLNVFIPAGLPNFTEIPITIRIGVEDDAALTSLSDSQARTLITEEGNYLSEESTLTGKITVIDSTDWGTGWVVGK